MRNLAKQDASQDAGTKRGSGGWQQEYAALQADILFGRLLPRERLIEDELILRFNATRHAVRRALDELEREGLVVRQPNRGVRVRDYSAKQVEDLYQIRSALEALAASLIPCPGDPAFVARLEEVAAQHRQASRAQNYWELSRLNNLFHELLYAGANNPELSAAIRHYSLVTQPIRSRGFPDAELRETAIREHREMIEAVEAGDRERLIALCRQHIEWPKQFYLKANGSMTTPSAEAGALAARG